MRKKRRSLSPQEANAYKAKKEGQAALVTAWMPLILLVAVFGISALFIALGVDLSGLKPVIELLAALR